MWFYAKCILAGHQKAEAAALGKPRGNLSDLYPRWLGTRELLLQRRDPYGAEVTRDIQAGYYGRPLDPNRPNDPTDQEAFAYPAYVVFLLAPTIFAPFSVVQLVFLWLLPLLIILTFFLWLRVLQWQPPWSVVGLLLILLMGSFQVVQAIELQQLTVVVSAMIAGAALLLARGRLAWAGVLLALATIKPQLAFLLVAWLLLWAASDWRPRQRFVWGFGITLGLLCLGAELALPGWIWRFRGAVENYRRYTGSASPLETLTSQILPGLWWGRALNALIVLAVLRACWKLRREPADSGPFAFTLALVLAATVVVIPMISPYNQLLLLPALFLLVRNWNAFWNKDLLAKSACVITSAVLFWPWIATLYLSAEVLFRPLRSVQEAWALPLYSSLGIPILVLGMLALQPSTTLMSRKTQNRR